MGFGRLLIVIGVVIALIGVAWPYLGRLGLGRLPGDLVIERGQSRFYFPVVTCLILSGLASLLLWLFRR